MHGLLLANCQEFEYLGASRRSRMAARHAE